MALDRQTAKNIGEIIGKAIAEEHPDLVESLRRNTDAIIKNYHKPWYTRLYERVMSSFYN